MCELCRWCNNINLFFFSVLQVWFEVEEEDMEGEKEEGQDAKSSIAFCLQAEHAGTRTYYFSTDSLEDREEWVQAMSEAAKVHISPPTRYMHTRRRATIWSWSSCTYLILYIQSAILPCF